VGDLPSRRTAKLTQNFRYLGPESLRWLGAICVESRDDLERLGATEAP